MKAIIGLVATVLVSAAAHAACPDLAGNYSCYAMGGLIRINIPVSQSTKGGTTVYVIDGAPIIADGNSHQAQTLPQLMTRYVRDVTYRAQCSGQAISFDGNGTMVKDGSPGTVRGVLTKTGASTVSLQVTMNSARGNRNVSANCQKDGGDDFMSYEGEQFEQEVEQY